MIEIADNERSNMATGNLAERAGSSGGFVFSNSKTKIYKNQPSPRRLTSLERKAQQLYINSLMI